MELPLCHFTFQLKNPKLSREGRVEHIFLGGVLTNQGEAILPQTMRATEG